MAQALLASPAPELVRSALRRPMLVLSRPAASQPKTPEVPGFLDAEDAQVGCAIQPVGPEDREWIFWSRDARAH